MDILDVAFGSAYPGTMIQKLRIIDLEDQAFMIPGIALML